MSLNIFLTFVSNTVFSLLFLVALDVFISVVLHLTIFFLSRLKLELLFSIYFVSSTFAPATFAPATFARATFAGANFAGANIA